MSRNNHKDEWHQILVCALWPSSLRYVVFPHFNALGISSFHYCKDDLINSDIYFSYCLGQVQKAASQHENNPDYMGLLTKWNTTSWSESIGHAVRRNDTLVCHLSCPHIVAANWKTITRLDQWKEKLKCSSLSWGRLTVQPHCPLRFTC